MFNSTKPLIICLPFAGSGASFFVPWQNLTDKVDIHPVQLPGREKRFMDSPFTDCHEAANGILEELQHSLSKERELIVFGHSLGAVLAFETAKRLEQSGFNVCRLIVSGSPDPWNQRSTRASDLECDDEFVEQVIKFSEFTHPALEDEMMKELLIPVLRADVTMHENYTPKSDLPAEFPIAALRGKQDLLVSDEQIRLWSKATKSEFQQKEFSGSHMYFVDNPKPLVDFFEDVSRPQ